MRHPRTPTQLRNVDLNLLKVFSAIMKERSITRAAASLYVTQPAISNALNRLRALLGDELFVRASKGVAPTPKAIEIAGTIERSLRLIESTLSAGSDFQPSSSRREFTLALTDYGESYFLPLLMKRVRAVAPGISFTCLPTAGAELIREMHSGAVDLVWDWADISHQQFRRHVIFRDRSYCLVRRDHPLIKQELTLDNFIEVGHVGLRPTSTHIPFNELRLEERGLERDVVLQVSHLLAMPTIVAETDLIASLPERLARHFAQRLGLNLFPNPVFDDAIPIYQIWHQRFDDDPAHRWLRETLIDLAVQHDQPTEKPFFQ